MLTIGEVVNQVEAVLVVYGSQVCLRDTETYAVGEALAERASSDLDAVGVTGFWVTGRQRSELTEVLEIVQGQLEAQKVEEDILESASGRKS